MQTEKEIWCAALWIVLAFGVAATTTALAMRGCGCFGHTHVGGNYGH